MKLLRHVLTCRRMGLGLAVLAVACAPGCAALTNPVADGIPVSRLPDEVLGESREGLQTVPLNRLGQVPPDQYRLAAGDLLGVVAEGVLGERNAPPPVQTDREQGGPPALGYPVPVQDDGTITLPFVPPIKVAGLTLPEAQARIVRALTEDREIIKKDVARVLVTLMRPRRYPVLVVREDAGTAGVPVGPGIGSGIGASLVGASRKGTGFTLDLPAYENDVLNALTRSGGLPGTDARNEVVVQRKPRAGAPPEVIRIP